MCRCCQTCLEDFYWNCIEEKFCYDETIAYYNPDEDEHYQKKSGNYLSEPSVENNNGPICAQPSSTALQRNCSTISSKVHEDYYREIQTNVPILAPEIISVFENSQIFHEHEPHHQKTPTNKQIKFGNLTPSVHRKRSGNNQSDSEKLLERLEGKSSPPTTTTTTAAAVQTNEATVSPFTPKKLIFNELGTGGDTNSNSSRQILPITEESETDGLSPPIDKNLLRPKLDNKILKHVQSAPYLNYRPASENDIFTITSSYGQISMTPEIPSISFSTLPKNYLDTPTIDKYREPPLSLHSIQTLNSAKIAESDLSMPRYYTHNAVSRVQSVENMFANQATTPKPKMIEKEIAKSKRLKNFRSTLPPLVLPEKMKTKEKDK